MDVIQSKHHVVSFTESGLEISPRLVKKFAIYSSSPFLNKIYSDIVLISLAIQFNVTLSKPCETNKDNVRVNLIQ